MPALRGTVLLFHLMRIMYVPSFGSLQNPQGALIGGKRDLESFAPVLVGSLVKWSTDSQAAARIIELESMELGLHRLAVT